MWASGTRFEGNWVDGKMHGRGKMEYADGSEFSGNFKNNLRHGHGTMYYGKGNGTPYESPLKSNSGRGKVLDGYGRCRYSGGWQHDRWHGHGVYYCSDGTMYEGEFRNGVRHGQGKQTLIPTTEEAGENLPTISAVRLVHGMDALYRPSVYEGSFVDGAWQGRGRLTFHGGFAIAGDFRPSPLGGGTPQGVCTVTFSEKMAGRSRKALFSSLGYRLQWLDSPSEPSRVEGEETSREVNPANSAD